MKFNTQILFGAVSLVAIMLITIVAKAQPLPPGGANVPIDGGAITVLLLGAGIAVRHYLKSDK